MRPHDVYNVHVGVRITDYTTGSNQPSCGATCVRASAGPHVPGSYGYTGVASVENRIDPSPRMLDVILSREARPCGVQSIADQFLVGSAYERVPRVAGLSPLDDQALAGVIMWVPGSIAFLLPAVVLTVELFEPRSRTTWTVLRRANTGARFRSSVANRSDVATQ